MKRPAQAGFFSHWKLGAAVRLRREDAFVTMVRTHREQLGGNEMTAPQENRFAAPALAAATAVNPYAAPRAAVADRGATSAAVLASRGQRLLAAIIDGLLIYVFAGSVAVAAYFMASTAAAKVTAAAAVIAVLVWNAVLIARHGQTVGKRAVKIRMVRSDGSDASFSRLFFLRGVLVLLLWSLPVIGALFWLVDVLCIFRDDRRCVHDMMADTKVVVAD